MIGMSAPNTPDEAKAGTHSPLTPERLRQLDELQKAIGYVFREPALLDLALTHSSHSNQSDATGANYESLEFLGDSVLGFVISEYLFLNHPDRSEGELSKMKSFLVARDQLYRLSSRLDMGCYLRLSRGEEKTGGRLKRAILADLFESVAAAIYLDGGMSAAREFVLAQQREQIEKISREEIDFKDYKSQLQERLHAAGGESPVYRVAEETGPDHRKEFFVEVWIEGRIAARGKGRSKKEAQQNAAEHALAAVRGS